MGHSSRIELKNQKAVFLFLTLLDLQSAYLCFKQIKHFFALL